MVCYRSRMAHSLARAIFHIVFSTKNRERLLGDSIREKLFAYIAVVGRDMKCEVYRVGGMPDHVHVAIDLGRNISLAEFTKKIKQSSSLWLKQQSPEFRAFSWQEGYGAFSVSQTHLPKLITYIQTQEEHHKTTSFLDEFRKLLEKNGVVVEENHIWG